jgi:hypothetical protein
LEKKTETELDLEVSNWRHETSDTPTFFYIRRSYIGIVLTPNFSKTNGLRVDFFRRPDAFTLDTDIPFDEIPELYPFHDSICYAVTIKCKQDEGDWISAEKLQLEFYKRISEIKEQVSFKNEETRLKNIYETVRSAPRRTR